MEIHAANTYLIEQFLRDSVNDRSGPYGGSIANRARLLLEVVAAIDRRNRRRAHGIRLSPMIPSPHRSTATRKPSMAMSLSSWRPSAWPICM